MQRNDGRQADELRPLSIDRNFIANPAGSVLLTAGCTRVLCTASVEESVPVFLKGKGTGWLTAEYGMLPASTHSRRSRDVSRGKIDGRTQEIQRLIGRSLRAAIDLTALGPRTIWIDCDVLQADGGTRTASITGAYIALHDAIETMIADGILKKSPLRTPVAAISVGLLREEPILDLNYEEDFDAEVDMNVVMTGRGEFVEIQGTAEKTTYNEDELHAMLALARKGISTLIGIQSKVTGSS